MPKEANEVHQHPITTPQALAPPSGKVGMTGGAGLASSSCGRSLMLFPPGEPSSARVLSEVREADMLTVVGGWFLG
jgi:hypothetical protein